MHNWLAWARTQWHDGARGLIVMLGIFALVVAAVVVNGFREITRDFEPIEVKGPLSPACQV